MLLSMISKYWLLFLLFLMTPALKSLAQGSAPSPDSLLLQSSVRQAASQVPTSQKRLYNGTEYIGYFFNSTKSHPYFQEYDWQSGHVDYDGVTYQSVPLLYDLVQDEIVVGHFNGTDGISLIKPLVKSFQLLGHTFFYLPENKEGKVPLAAGFYDCLFEGKVQLWARHTKTLEQYNKATKSAGYFPLKVRYFLKKNQEYHQVQNKREVLQVFADKKEEVEAFIKENKLSFSKRREEDLKKVAAFGSTLYE